VALENSYGVRSLPFGSERHITPYATEEIKFDGYRAVAFKTGGKVQLRSRNDKEFTLRYPGIAKALASLPGDTVVDGEVVALDGSGSRRSMPCRTTDLHRRRCFITFSMSSCWVEKMLRASRS
jgi:hypothetical protein